MADTCFTGHEPTSIVPATPPATSAAPVITTLQIAAIRTDGGTQPRASIDRDLVHEYAATMQDGTKFPPLVVFWDGTSHWLADGFHRNEASKEVGLAEIECEVHNGTLDEARWYSFSANKAHGARRTNKDKERALRAALAHPKSAGLSDEQIGIHVGVHRNTVLAYRTEATCTNCASEPARRTGKDGRAINTAKIGKSTSRAQAKRKKPVAPKRKTAAPVTTPVKAAVAEAAPVEEPPIIAPTVMMREEPPAETVKVVLAIPEETAPEPTIPEVVAVPVADLHEPKTVDAGEGALRVPFPAPHLRAEPPASIAPTVELVVRSIVRQLEQKFSAESENGDAMLFHIILRLQNLRRSS